MDPSIILIQLTAQATRLTGVKAGSAVFRQECPELLHLPAEGQSAARLGGGQSAAARLESLLATLPEGFRSPPPVLIIGAAPDGFGPDSAEAPLRLSFSHLLDSGGRPKDLFHHANNRPFSGFQADLLRRFPQALIAPTPVFALAAGLSRIAAAVPPRLDPAAWVDVGPTLTTAFVATVRRRTPRSGAPRGFSPAGLALEAASPKTPAPSPPLGMLPEPSSSSAGAFPASPGARTIPAPQSPTFPQPRPGITNDQRKQRTAGRRRPLSSFRLTAVLVHRTAALNPGKLDDYLIRALAGHPLDVEIRLDGGLFAETRAELGRDEGPEVYLYDPGRVFAGMAGVFFVEANGGLSVEEEGMLQALAELSK